MSQYFVVRFSNVNETAEEFLSHVVFEWGAAGMSEVLAFRQPEGEEDVFTVVSDARDIDVYFESVPDQGLLELVRSRFPEVAIKVQTEQNRDWMAEWKKGFRSFPLVRDHWVVPSWLEAPAEAKQIIRVDPGMAFGTGTHETTQLVAEYLYELLPPNKFESLLDVGTGTGILAILARQLGVPKVAATELEPEARRVAHENFELNQMTEIQLDERQVEDLKQQFDVVCANIIDGVLVRIQEALKTRVKPGGWLIVSGIITERDQDFLNGFAATWKVRRQKGDWILYAAQL